MQTSLTKVKSQRLQTQNQTTIKKFAMPFRITRKVTRSVCDTRSQQKQYNDSRREIKKNCKAENNPIIHSMFPKVRGENSGFIQTLKLIKKRRLSHLLIAESNLINTSLQNSKNHRDLVPTSSKINKIQQCQQQVKKYLEQLNRRRKSQSFNIMRQLNDKDKSNNKKESQKDKMQNSILSHVTIGQQFVKQRLPIKRLMISPANNLYSQYTVAIISKRQSIRQSKSLNLHTCQAHNPEDQNLVCKQAPMNTMQNTKNLFKTKTKINLQIDVSQNLKQMGEQKDVEQGIKNKKFSKIAVQTIQNLNIFRFGEKGISPWQSYYPNAHETITQ